MRKFTLLLTVFITLTLFITGCSSKKSQNTFSSGSNNANTSNQTIKVALDATYKPMEWIENNKVTGFDADLVTAIGKQIGKQIGLTNVSWDEIFDKLYARNYDLIISCVGINDERKTTMIFSDPYFVSKPLIITKSNSGIKSAKDLSKKKVAVQGDTTTEALITKNIAGVNIKKFTSAVDVLNSITTKSVDAVVIDSPVALDYTKSNPNYITIEDNAFFGQENFAIAANKGNEALINEINIGLAKVKASGEYQTIYNKYFGK